jgi:hypothetical protein
MTPENDNKVYQETEKFLTSYAAATADNSLTWPRLSKDLLNLLECPHQSRPTFRADIIVPRHVAENRSAIKKCLPAMFLAIGPQSRPRANVTSLLGGLHHTQCWQDLLTTEESTYLLAAALVGFVDACNKTFTLDVVVAPAVCAMLNSWLNPPQAWDTLPTAGDTCAHFFGHAWAQLSLPPDCWEPGGGLSTRLDVVRDKVLHDRPLFLPGLCPTQKDRSGEILPELGQSP